MNSSAWRRKLLYIGIMVLMLIPLYLLGQPATGGGDSSGAGGALARLRDTYNIAEADLGDIDPASESMKLATLGMRGVAATVLWQKQHDYYRHQEWDRVSATLNQIALLQPHFENVWEHQAHNLSYNISSEFDDYRQRYAWVKKGINFLTRGVKLNRREPRLIWKTGWFYGQKLGMSDEKIQFRALFRDDTEFHNQIQTEDPIDVENNEAHGPDGKPDNWLVGRLWLNFGYELVDAGTKLINKTPLTFFDLGPKWRIRHAVSIEEEGTINDLSRDAWRLAEQDWRNFGRREIETLDSYTVQLGGLQDADYEMGDIEREFDKLTDDRRKKLRDQVFASFSQELKDAFNTPFSERSAAQQEAVTMNRIRLVTDMKSVARQVEPEKQLTALRLAEAYEAADRRAKKIRGYRNQINYGYWVTRCEAEQKETTLKARKLIFDADAFLDKAMLDEALETYEEGFAEWAKVYEEYPVLVSDAGADDIQDKIIKYIRMLDEPEPPEDFPLRTFMESRIEGPPSPAEYVRLLNEKKKREEAEAAKEKAEPETANEKKPDNPPSPKEAENKEPSDKEKPAQEDTEKPSDDAKEEASDGDENGKPAESKGKPESEGDGSGDDKPSDEEAKPATEDEQPAEAEGEPETDENENPESGEASDS